MPGMMVFLDRFTRDEFSTLFRPWWWGAGTSTHAGIFPEPESKKQRHARNKREQALPAEQFTRPPRLTGRGRAP